MARVSFFPLCKNHGNHYKILGIKKVLASQNIYHVILVQLFCCFYNLRLLSALFVRRVVVFDARINV